MNKPYKTILAGILFFVLIGLGYSLFMGQNHASACGWGRQGGQGYVPERRDNAMGPYAARSFLTQEQAYDIVSNHVKKLNPNLRVGQINDAGNFFEAEILSESNEIVQLMGVDKQTGRLMIIN